jgi:hypothetical protein
MLSSMMSGRKIGTEAKLTKTLLTKIVLSKFDVMRRITGLFAAKYAVNNFGMRRINSIFTADYAEIN